MGCSHSKVDYLNMNNKQFRGYIELLAQDVMWENELSAPMDKKWWMILVVYTLLLLYHLRDPKSHISYSSLNTWVDEDHQQLQRFFFCIPSTLLNCCRNSHGYYFLNPFVEYQCYTYLLWLSILDRLPIWTILEQYYETKLIFVNMLRWEWNTALQVAVDVRM